jgi:putative ABC transport system permease protein
MLADGGAIAFHPIFATNGKATLLAGSERIAVDALVVPVNQDYSALPGLVITPATAQRLGLRVTPKGVVFDTVRAPSNAELYAANTILLTPQARAAVGTFDTPIQLQLAEPSRSVTRDRTETMSYVLIVLSAMVSLLAAAAAISLATAESRDDLSTMVAVGVTPRVRRGIAGAQAGVVVGLATLLGFAVGTIPAAGLVAYSVALRWRTPWIPLGVTVIVVPLAMTVAARFLARTRLVLTRRVQ